MSFAFTLRRKRDITTGHYKRFALNVCAAAAAILLLLPACEREAKTARQPGRYDILLVGDTSFGEEYGHPSGKGTVGDLLRKRGYDSCLTNFKPLLDSADLIIANLETPLTPPGKSPFAGRKNYLKTADPVEGPACLARHNIRVVSLANNHTLDFGTEGLNRTIDALDRAGIAWFGAGPDETLARAPLVRSVAAGDMQFTLVVIAAFEYRANYDEEFNYYARGDASGVHLLDVERLAEQIRAIKETDPEPFVLVFPHWGENYRWRTAVQSRDAHRLIDAGADLVIGHGAHMMQEIERYRDRWILYGIGNFVFNSPGRYAEKKVDPFSLIARLHLEAVPGGVRKTLHLYPLFSDNRITDFRPRFVTDEEFDRAVSLLREHWSAPPEFDTVVRHRKDPLGHFLALGID